jgi:peptide/nickel transport system ATP-binding protein
MILCADAITKTYGKKTANRVSVLTDFSLDLSAGETVGLVGPSGCGKSTFARILAGLEKPDSGTILYQKKDIYAVNRDEWRQYRRGVQMIFQDPTGSFNPVHTIRQSLSMVLTHAGVPRAQHQEVLKEMLYNVGVHPEILGRYPDQISGGQAQRVAIARVLIMQPAVMILDEPTSALDVSVQAQILHLFKKVQQDNNIAYLFISHDASVVEFMADRIVRM